TAAAKAGAKTAALFNVAQEPAEPGIGDRGSGIGNQGSDAALQPVRSFVAKLIAFFAIITVTFGNLAAFGQNNLKRLLAYSTIAHAGYMLMGLAVITKAGAAGVLYYLSAYVAMNLGAFGVVALVRNATGSEDISAVRGLVK